ncbi:hypothetical protein SAMN00808754_2328 [Thermanaeromonas toyohensis ToBE]|uniref:Uncharacterized protein n=2 Tax=Thermanaeromonas TaxID=202949 RepID=A0A1W1VYH8_9FIRM|nr:hypothetical protein SAMN00808754_2328 [Thermanaeromonas toyohensis ToBE]
MGGGLWLADLKAVKAAIANERSAVAVLLGVLVSLFAAGFPAGWLAGERFNNYTSSKFSRKKNPLPKSLAIKGVAAARQVKLPRYCWGDRFLID